MKTKFLFEYKIAIMMTIMMTLLAVIGVYTFKRFSTIITKISLEARPDLKLIYIKTLITDIAEAENQVKSYSLTKDTFYLNEYIKNEWYLKQKINDIKSNFVLNADDTFLVDTLCKLMNEKLMLLNYLIDIQEQFRVGVALDKVVDQIEKYALKNKQTIKTEPTTNQSKTTVEKWQIFKKSKPKTSEIEKTASKNLEFKNNAKIDLKTVSNNITEIKKQEDAYNQRLIQLERLYIEEDKTVNMQIRKLMEAYETKELLKIEDKVKEAEIEVDKTNWQIAFFCVAIGVLLLIMTGIILNYVKTNTRFRKALKKAKKEAEDLAKTKERFLANMSHEIRTPMNAIAGFSEQISKGPLNVEQRKQMELVLKSTHHLLFIINDILDYSKLQHGKLSLENFGFEIHKEIEDLCQLVNPIAQDKNITVQSEIDENMPKYIIGDPFRLRQILLNILSNAIKFTNSGLVKLNVSSVMLLDNNLNINFEIIDSGVGMTEAQLSKVFKEFEQAETSTTRVYGGTGLGLTITKKLIDLFEGKITIESTPEKGTKVVINIPFKQGDIADVPVSKTSIYWNKNDLNNLKILIVDDEPYNRMLLITILKKLKVNYAECENGRLAFEEILRNNYDLILMDMRMPELNGIDATKKIRALNNNKKKNVPIIALSAAVSEEDKVNYFKSGMNGYLPKPFSENELLNEIARVLKLNKTQKTVSENVANNIINTDVIDLTELKNLSAGDTLFYKDMLITFLNGAINDFETIKKANQEKDCIKISNYAHKICAPCKHIGANKLYELLKNIELNCTNISTQEISNLIDQIQIELSKVVKNIENELASLPNF